MWSSDRGVTLNEHRSDQPHNASVSPDGQVSEAAAPGDEEVVSKIKLSDALKALTGQFNAITGTELEFELVIDDDEVAAGSVLRARAVVSSPEDTERTLSCVRIELHGQVQSDGQWDEYTERAETAHDIPLPAESAYVIPIVIKIPAHAVFSRHGAHWRLRAQAVVDRTIDPRDEISITVVGE